MVWSKKAKRCARKGRKIRHSLRPENGTTWMWKWEEKVSLNSFFYTVQFSHILVHAQSSSRPWLSKSPYYHAFQSWEHNAGRTGWAKDGWRLHVTGFRIKSIWKDNQMDWSALQCFYSCNYKSWTNKTKKENSNSPQKFSRRILSSCGPRRWCTSSSSSGHSSF